MSMSRIENANLSDLDFGASAPLAGTEEETPQVQEPENTDEVVETQTDETEAEPAKPAPKPESEIKKINNQMAAIRRQSQAVKKQQEALQAQTAQLNAAMQQLAEREAKVADLEKMSDLDEIGLIDKYSKTKGVPAIQVMRNLLAKMSGVYEEPEQPKEPELDPRIVAELQARDKKLAEMEQKMEAQKLAEAQAQEEALMESYAESGMDLISEESFPLLHAEAETDLAWVKDNYLEIADRYAEKTNGQVPEPQEVLEYMEEILSARAERLSSALQKKTSRDKNDKDSKESTPAKGAGTPASSENAEAPKALTNRLATERSTPTESARLSDRERTKAAAQWLAQQRHRV